MDDSLYDEIEYVREVMIETASKKGMNAKETIEISRKLDELLTQLDDSKKQTLDQV